MLNQTTPAGSLEPHRGLTWPKYWHDCGFGRFRAALAGSGRAGSRRAQARRTVVFHISSFLGDGVSGGVATFIVDDLDALHAELTERRVPIDVEPTDQSWDNREMYVRDPDRNSVRFVQGKGN